MDLQWWTYTPHHHLLSNHQRWCVTYEPGTVREVPVDELSFNLVSFVYTSQGQQVRSNSIWWQRERVRSNSSESSLQCPFSTSIKSKSFDKNLIITIGNLCSKLMEKNLTINNRLKLFSLVFTHKFSSSELSPTEVFSDTQLTRESARIVPSLISEISELVGSRPSSVVKDSICLFSFICLSKHGREFECSYRCSDNNDEHSFRDPVVTIGGETTNHESPQTSQSRESILTHLPDKDHHKNN